MRSVCQWNRSETGLRKNDKNSEQTDHDHPQSPSEATPSSPLGTWDEAMTRVEEKWCTPYRR